MMIERHSARTLGPGWSRAFAAAVALALAAYFFLTTGTQSIVYDAVAVGAALVMILVVVVVRPTPRFAWALIAAGTLMLALGDVAYGISQPVPSTADMLYVSAYPLLAFGLIGLTPRFGPGRQGSALIHSSLAAAAIGVVAMVLILVPATQHDGVTLIARAVSLAYPLMDIALLAMLLRAVHFETDRRTPLWLLGAAIVLRLVADTGFALLDFGTSYGLGDPLDVAWLLSYTCSAVALLHPSLARGAGEKAFGRVPPAPPLARAPRPGPGPRTSPAQSQVVRLRVVLAWTGRMLFVLGVIALGLAGAWGSPNLILLSGAYAGTGSVIILASLIRI